jgi:hypothetical protein
MIFAHRVSAPTTDQVSIDSRIVIYPVQEQARISALIYLSLHRSTLQEGHPDGHFVCNLAINQVFCTTQTIPFPDTPDNAEYPAILLIIITLIRQDCTMSKICHKRKIFLT